MALQLHKKYRIVVSNDRRNFTLQYFSKGINPHTGKVGKGRWVDEAYCGTLVSALERYINDRMADKVGGETGLIPPKEILNEYKVIKKELENMFSLPVDQIIDDLRPNQIPLTEAEKNSGRGRKKSTVS